eukprot:TRINITY_DN13035_c0_g1_i1.p1 TRINITY_DN13035_c0_g1~~TRINITY_DN13035_c0_g1_i1.p1  ORF type:complete len:432 (-),score=95.86 TRINITY_DN13035_c0_g1_i1:1392-2687(-)
MFKYAFVDFIFSSPIDTEVITSPKPTVERTAVIGGITLAFKCDSENEHVIKYNYPNDSTDYVYSEPLFFDETLLLKYWCIVKDGSPSDVAEVWSSVSQFPASVSRSNDGTITLQNSNGANMYYKVADIDQPLFETPKSTVSEDWIVYTEPFKLTKASLVGGLFTLPGYVNNLVNFDVKIFNPPVVQSSISGQMVTFTFEHVPVIGRNGDELDENDWKIQYRKNGDECVDESWAGISCCSFPFAIRDSCDYEFKLSPKSGNTWLSSPIVTMKVQEAVPKPTYEVTNDPIRTVTFAPYDSSLDTIECEFKPDADQPAEKVIYDPAEPFQVWDKTDFSCTISRDEWRSTSFSFTVEAIPAEIYITPSKELFTKSLSEMENIFFSIHRSLACASQVEVKVSCTLSIVNQETESPVGGTRVWRRIPTWLTWLPKMC